MSSRQAKIAASIGGGLPAVSVVVASCVGDSWLILAVVGLFLALAVTVGWLLLRQPFFEISETVRGGSRRRIWQVGVAQSPTDANNASLSPPKQPNRKTSARHRADFQE